MVIKKVIFSLAVAKLFCFGEFLRHTEMPIALIDAPKSPTRGV